MVMANLKSQMSLIISHNWKTESWPKQLSQTPVLGLGLGVAFTFAWDNDNTNYNHNNNPHLNFVKGTVLGDKEQGVGIRDEGYRVRPKLII